MNQSHHLSTVPPSSLNPLIASQRLASFEAPLERSRASKSPCRYQLFRVKRSDGRITTVSVNPALAARAIEAIGGWNPTAEFVRTLALEYKDGTSKSCSGYVSEQLEKRTTALLREKALKEHQPARAEAYACKSSVAREDVSFKWKDDPQLRGTIIDTRKTKSFFFTRSGGFLYRVTDHLTGKRYIGITTLSVEVRWRSHLDKALHQGSTTALHSAMREHLASFEVECVAYYRDVHDLREAERTHILDEGTRWPTGYNSSAGGEINFRGSKNVLDRYIERRALSAAQARHLRQCEIWLPMLGLSKEGLFARLERNLPYLTVVSTPCQDVRRTQPVTFEGVEYPSISAALKALNIPVSRFSSVRRAGKTVQEALVEARSRLEKRGFKAGGRAIPVTVQGVRYPSVRDACNALHLKEAAVYKAVRNGRPADEALELAACGKRLGRSTERDSRSGGIIATLTAMRKCAESGRSPDNATRRRVLKLQEMFLAGELAPAVSMRWEAEQETLERVFEARMQDLALRKRKTDEKRAGFYRAQWTANLARLAQFQRDNPRLELPVSRQEMDPSLRRFSRELARAWAVGGLNAEQRVSVAAAELNWSKRYRDLAERTQVLQ